jgi:pre-mRNA-splicing factor ISY1
LSRRVDAGYFGYNRDEEDGTLLEYEVKREGEAVEAMQERAMEAEDDWEPLPGDAGDGVDWTVPTLPEVEEELIDRSKRRLLDQLG